MNTEISVVKAQNTFLARVYGWMTLALCISGVVAFGSAMMMVSPDGEPTVLFSFLFGNRFGFLFLSIAEIALVWWLSASIRKISATAATVAYIVYSVLNGLTLSSIFFVYSGESIAVIFFVSAALFAAMSVYGMITKSDLNSFGRYFFMGLVGLIIASLVNIFLRSSTIEWFLSIVTVLLFTGLTAYDTQKMLRASQAAEGMQDTDVFKKASIIGALELYLDFINIFLALLRLFGRKRS